MEGASGMEHLGLMTLLGASIQARLKQHFNLGLKIQSVTIVPQREFLPSVLCAGWDPVRPDPVATCEVSGPLFCQ